MLQKKRVDTTRSTISLTHSNSVSTAVDSNSSSFPQRPSRIPLSSIRSNIEQGLSKSVSNTDPNTDPNTMNSHHHHNSTIGTHSTSISTQNSTTRPSITLPRNAHDTPTHRIRNHTPRDTRVPLPSQRTEYLSVLKKKSSSYSQLSSSSQPQSQIQSQQQEKDLQFFQELEGQDSKALPLVRKEDVLVPTTTTTTTTTDASSASSPASSPNPYLAQMESLKLQNMELQTSLQSILDQTTNQSSTSPTSNKIIVSSSDAYKKALRLQSDLLDSKIILQEEIARRERAEMNLDCLRLEMEDQRKQQEEWVGGLERLLEERMKDLDDGVLLMKGLEDEILETKALLEEEERKNDQWMEQYGQFEKEKDELAEGLMHQMKEHQENMVRMEERFKLEKQELEDQCVKLQDEIEQMKERVKEMEEKRRLKDEMMDELQDLQDDMEATIRNMQAVDEEKEDRIAELEDHIASLEKDLQDSHEKVRSMEEVVNNYNQMSRQEMQELVDALEEARGKEHKAREESGEYLSKLKDAQDEIELLCSEMETIHIELEQKRVYAEEAEKQIASLSESMKTISTDKAKQHQYMRDRKKWSMTEKALRQELEEVLLAFSKYKEEHGHILEERDELNKECFKMDDENAYMKEQVQSLQAKVDEYCFLLEEKEAESMNQIKALEKELYRAQQQASGISPPASSPSLARSREVDALKKATLLKDQEIASLKDMLKNDRNELSKLRDWLNTDPSFPSTKSTVSKDAQKMSSTMDSSHAKTLSEPFNAFEHVDDDEVGADDQDDVQPIQEFTSTHDNLDWDEMDDHMTAHVPNASTLGHQKQRMVTPEDERKERASIENDAVRRYMRLRRKSN